MNRLLKRQLKRQFGKDFDISSLEPKIQELLLNIDETYDEFTKEKTLLENTLDMNSTELYEANQAIIHKNEDLNKLLKKNSALLQNTTEENLEIGTQLKQYKQAMDTALLVITFDLEKKITFANDNFCTLSAFSNHELLKKNYDFLYIQADNSELSDKVFTTIQNKNIWNGIIKLQSRDKKVYDLNTTIFPILNAHSKITEYMGIFQDITDLEKSRQKALELDKAKSLFIANMSHELRTPLNSIIGFSQILRRQDQIPDKLRNYIKKINFSGEHLLKLINSILDFSKIEAGEVKLEKIELNLYTLINTALVQQEINAKQKGLELLVEYDKNLTQLFLGDSLRLTQIITNLISNAIKFTDTGYVKTIVEKTSQNRIKVTIQDTGIGLSDANKEKLFKEFSQADNSTSRQYGGTGLGLSISKELVKLMDGKIWVESIQGQGSSFIFEIFLHELEDISLNIEEEDDSAKQDLIPLNELNTITGKTILLVEDNITNQLLIEALLEDTQIKLEIANNGLEALNMVNQKHKHYDLILMDLQMPIMNGFEVTVEIRRDDTHVPIIALSANVVREDIERTKAIGMNEYLSKPIVTEKFYACLLKYLS